MSTMQRRFAMQDEMSERELKERLSLIENMIAEGRRRTESWGWTFILWGVAYYVAIGWSVWGHSTIAWPVTMIAASLLTAVVGSRTARNDPETTLGRAMMAIWAGLGISVFLLMLSLGISGRLELHVAVAIVGAMLGMANATSSILLKWKMQFICALVWWASAIAASFTSDIVTSVIFLSAIFFCQIVFGIYGMVAESRKHKANRAGQGVSHA
jgi:fatty acid desaturase